MRIWSGPGANAWKHGEHSSGKPTVEYQAFHAAKKRCQNKNAWNFKYYGKRGIKFLFKSFADFLKAVGRKPSSRYVLDRIDNDGHYEPGNVRWATHTQSVRNSRMTHRRKIAWKLRKRNTIGQFI
jgi:hypothetical protein